MKRVEWEEDPDGAVFKITVADVSTVSRVTRKSPKVRLSVKVGEVTLMLEATPDTGAELTVISPDVAKQLGADLRNLHPGNNKLYAANKTKLTCLGSIKSEITLGVRTVSVSLAVVKEVQGFLLSWYHAQDLGILHESYPEQIKALSNESESSAVVPYAISAPPTCREVNPDDALRQKHEQLMKDKFADVLDTSTQLKVMSGDPMRIQLMDDAVPFALTRARVIPVA